MTDFAARASRSHWDLDAADYHRRHPEYLSGFYWCPEMLSEEDLNLLGATPPGARVLELGCGSAPCAGALQYARPDLTIIGLDISMGMLRHATAPVALVQADAAHPPFADGSFDVVFSVFGAIAFIQDLTALFTQVRRLLPPGGRFLYSCTHPMRWVFPDDPGKEGLVADIPYWSREYIEHSPDGEVCYAEFHHTFADHVAALHAAGFHLEAVCEPSWPDGATHTWGQWSPLRGRIFPGTAIFQATAVSQTPGAGPPHNQ